MQRDKRAHRKFGDIFGRVNRGDFASWRAFVSSPIVGWLFFIVFCVVITALMTFSISNIPDQIVSGTIAQHDVRADKNYEIVDEEATSRFQQEAVNGVLNVYDYDSTLGKKTVERVSQAFEDARRRLIGGETQEAIKTAFETSLGVIFPSTAWNELISNNFNKGLELAINLQVQSAMSRYIAEDEDMEVILAEKQRGCNFRDVMGKETALGPKEIVGILSIDDVKKRLVEGKYAGVKKVPVSSEIASLVVKPNIDFNLQETDGRKAAASANVKSVIIKVEAGEVVIRAGARYEPRHVIILNGMRQEKEKSFTPLRVMGTFLLVALVIMSAYYFAERYIKKFAPQKIDLYFMGILLVFILLILRFSVSFFRAMHDSMGVDIPLTAFYYVIPVSSAAMLVRFILNSETAMIFSVALSIFAGVFVGGSLNYTSYCMISCIAAAASIAYADKRSTIFRAGLYTAIINILAATSIQFVHSYSLTEPLTFVNILWYVLFSALGGILCSVMVMMVTPIVEFLFGYTTDIKLLELANLNHPLLRELVIRAPGTYHHSHLVGILAESASEVIGANPLLTRVAAYYHDIGKIRKPLYFVENTTDCESRHDSLSPHMSALIVASHVKDGMELAKEYKIPKKIADMIPEHHGTKMISFFFEKAKKAIDPAKDKIDEKDFRYQGPKPQTREAGILLLADAVEAAVRSLKEKSPSRIQQMVEDVINNSFTEAQLDECDLTLRNLHDIAGSFTKILMGIYHQRIEYPKEMLEQQGGQGPADAGA